MSLFELLFDAVHQFSTDIGAVGRVNFANAGRAGDVDLGQVITDHVQTDKQQPAAAQLRTYLGRNPAIALTQRACLTAPTGGEIAAGFTGLRNPRQAVGYRLAIDHQDALVAVLDLRQITLRHDLLLAMQGKGFDDHADIRVILANPEDHGAAHAIQRLENHVFVFADERPQDVGAA